MIDRRRQPRRIRELTWSTWRGALGRAVAAFDRDNCTDMAAALTYYGVLAIFPSVVVVVSLVGLLVDSPDEATKQIGQFLNDLGASGVSSTVEKSVSSGLHAHGAAKALLSFGLLGTIWTASGYIGAFTRASNTIHGVPEGRPFYRLRPIQFVLAFLAIVLLAVVGMCAIVGGALAELISKRLELGDSLPLAWSIARWPLFIAAGVGLLSLLFWIAPNVQQPRFRWMTVGGAVTASLWLIATAAFSLYVENLGSFNKTYGGLGAIIAFLVWLYLSNCALIFGVQVNVELQRGRQRQGGVEPADYVLPPRHDPDAVTLSPTPEPVDEPA
jgi:membrane protein